MIRGLLLCLCVVGCAHSPPCPAVGQHFEFDRGAGQWGCVLNSYFTDDGQKWRLTPGWG